MVLGGRLEIWCDCREVKVTSSPGLHVSWGDMEPLRLVHGNDAGAAAFSHVCINVYWGCPRLQAEEEVPAYADVTFGKNANLGRWTNFVNLQDMCGVSVFSGLLRLPHQGERGRRSQSFAGEAELVGLC